MHWAIKRGHVRIIAELYDYGADLEAVDIVMSYSVEKIVNCD